MANEHSVKYTLCHLIFQSYKSLQEQEKLFHSKNSLATENISEMQIL